jgi:signal-transduction protein with cAMP-binding, CBS, and nucleotidyltransferase domain
MKISALYNPMTVAAQTWETLSEVATRMQFNDVGAVAVFDEGRLAGILTERDLARAIADGADPRQTTAADYMTAEPAVVELEDDAKTTASTMLDLGIRHLPVVQDGKVLGVVSIRDVLSDLVWSA